MLLALPITGCLFSWSAGHPAPVLYLFEIPRLVQDNPELLAIIKPVHIYLSWFAGFSGDWTYCCSVKTPFY